MYPNTCLYRWGLFLKLADRIRSALAESFNYGQHPTFYGGFNYCSMKNFNSRSKIPIYSVTHVFPGDQWLHLPYSPSKSG